MHTRVRRITGCVLHVHVLQAVCCGMGGTSGSTGGCCHHLWSCLAHAQVCNTVHIVCDACRFTENKPQLMNTPHVHVCWQGILQGVPRLGRVCTRIYVCMQCNLWLLTDASPMCVLLTPAAGAGHVGRGFASMPVQHLSEAGLASGLSTLAETAVVVSTTMLCCAVCTSMARCQQQLGLHWTAMLLHLPGTAWRGMCHCALPVSLTVDTRHLAYAYATPCVTIAAFQD